MQTGSRDRCGGVALKMLSLSGRGGTKRGPADRMLAASGEAEKVEIFFGVTKDEDFREEEEEEETT